MRTEQQQRQVDQLTSKMALYQFDTCPFCMNVKYVIKSLNLNIEMRNIHKDRTHLKDLIEGGRKETVPCLRIEKEDGSVQWMYESLEIIAYLQKQFRS
ncbi:glutathione S-transferase N-terminal domain-containing protein [Deltaproteobacteria bacterium TL4]